MIQATADTSDYSSLETLEPPSEGRDVYQNKQSCCFARLKSEFCVAGVKNNMVRCWQGKCQGWNDRIPSECANNLSINVDLQWLLGVCLH